MKYAIILLPALLLGCSSESDSPVNPLAIVPQVSEPVTEPTETVEESTPESTPGETQQPDPVEQPDPVIDPVDDEPVVEVEPVAVEQAPVFIDPFTNEEVTLTRAAFTTDDFSLNGLMWECVDMEFGVRGDFWSFVPGSKAVNHHPDGTADLFEDANANITAAGSGLPWSVTDGVYFGPLNLHGIEWVQKETVNGADIYYVWIDQNNRRNCYERRE